MSQDLLRQAAEAADQRNRSRAADILACALLRKAAANRATCKGPNFQQALSDALTAVEPAANPEPTRSDHNEFRRRRRTRRSSLRLPTEIAAVGGTIPNPTQAGPGSPKAE